jgi:hypothetical protein
LIEALAKADKIKSQSIIDSILSSLKSMLPHSGSPAVCGKKIRTGAVSYKCFTCG